MGLLPDLSVRRDLHGRLLVHRALPVRPPRQQPYCHFRARTLAARGRRERLVPVAPAEGVPFDCARFELIEEPLDAPTPAPLPAEELVAIRLRPRRDHGRMTADGSR